jgi:hypothetical protein
MQLNPAKLTALALILLTPNILLSSCAPAKKIEIVQTPVAPQPIILPDTSVLDLDEVEFIVITPENAATVFADLEKGGKSMVLFAVTSDGYESLSLNMAQILKLLSEQKAVIIAYDRYYKQPVSSN